MDKTKRKIFIIMPFTKTPLRNKDDLDSFFEVNLKSAIECEESFSFQYIVSRSNDSFDITADIIKDIYLANIVICDLSGNEANPNVMYELGLRMALSNEPVILIREENEKNKKIFDINHFHIHEYKVQQYKKLQDFLISKIKKFENEEEVFVSPITKILSTEPNIVLEMKRNSFSGVLKSSMLEIDGLLKKLSGAIAAFLDENQTEWEFNNHNEALLYLYEHQEGMQSIVWRNFSFEIKALPAFTNLLINREFLLFLSDETKPLVSKFLYSYYTYFMSSNIVFYSFTQLYNFLGETHALNDILTCCYGLVSNSSDISSEAREEFVKYIKYWSNNSSFFGNKTDTVEIKKQQSELLKENCPTKVST